VFLLHFWRAALLGVILLFRRVFSLRTMKCHSISSVLGGLWQEIWY
jgi:hypothetical protein